MTRDDIRILKSLRAELSAQIAALDSAISICEQVSNDFATVSAEPEAVEPFQARTAGGAKFSSGIDISKVPDINRNGGGVRL